jgi:hypothetical protein
MNVPRVNIARAGIASNGIEGIQYSPCMHCGSVWVIPNGQFAWWKMQIDALRLATRTGDVIKIPVRCPECVNRNPNPAGLANMICAECGKKWFMNSSELRYWLLQLRVEIDISRPLRCLRCRDASGDLHRGALGAVITPPPREPLKHWACQDAWGVIRKRYSTRADAEFAEERQRKDRHYDQQYAYLCPLCSTYHLRSTPLETEPPTEGRPK